MKLTVKGKAKRVATKKIERAAKFYASKLLSKRLIPNIDLKIKLLDPAKLDYTDGWCDWKDRSHKPRVFTIGVNKDLKPKRMLIALAHEMVHMKQFAVGEMKDMSGFRVAKWCGKLIHRDQIDYWDLPWEIEAFGKELGLYLRFLDEEDT